MYVLYFKAHTGSFSHSYMRNILQEDIRYTQLRDTPLLKLHQFVNALQNTVRVAT